MSEGSDGPGKALAWNSSPYQNGQLDYYREISLAAWVAKRELKLFVYIYLEHKLIHQGKLLHLGPHFPTYFSHNSSTNPDKKNFQTSITTWIALVNITTSDHLPVIFKLSTTPFIVEKPKIYEINKADWDLFHHKLDSKINITNFDENNVEQLEEATKDWIKSVKSAMDIAIPKSSYQHI